MWTTQHSIQNLILHVTVEFRYPSTVPSYKSMKQQQTFKTKSCLYSQAVLQTRQNVTVLSVILPDFQSTVSNTSTWHMKRIGLETHHT